MREKVKKKKKPQTVLAKARIKILQRMETTTNNQLENKLCYAHTHT